MLKTTFYSLSIRLIILIFIISFGACKKNKETDILIENVVVADTFNQKFIIENDINLNFRIDSLFNKSLNSSIFSGAALSIVIGNKVVLQKTYGYSNARLKTPLTNQSIFRLGSVSKSITGIVSGILFQQGKINFNEKVSEYDTDFSLYNLRFTENIKLSHLLSHTSGLPYHSYTNLVEHGLPMKKIVCKFSDILNLEPPGTLYSYQNAAFAESGEVLSLKLKMPVQEIFKTTLFNPLGMKNASMTQGAITKSLDYAKPHKKLGGKWIPQPINKKYYNAIPAGGINASIEDMSKVLLLLMGNTPGLLSEASIDSITTPRIDTKVKYRYYKKWAGFENSYYGYGWRIHTFLNPSNNGIDTLIHHGGQVNNYRSEIGFDRKNKIAVCILFNSYTSLANTIIPDVISIVKDIKKDAQHIDERL